MGKVAPILVWTILWWLVLPVWMPFSLGMWLIYYPKMWQQNLGFGIFVTIWLLDAIVGNMWLVLGFGIFWMIIINVFGYENRR